MQPHERNMSGLIPLSERSEEERRAIAIKGATASNAIQKQQKQLRTILAELLEMPANSDEAAANALEKLNLPNSHANVMLMKLLGIVTGKDVCDADRLKGLRLIFEVTGDITSVPRLTNVSLAVGGGAVVEEQPQSKIDAMRELGDEIRRQMMQE